MPLFPQPASTTNSNNIFNLVFTTTVASNALTVNFIANNTQANATTANPATVGFGSGGQISFISLTSAYSFTVPSGATLGTPSATAVNLYVYALNVSGTMKGAISFVPFTTEDVTVTTVALTSGSTSNRTMYSDGAYSGVTYRLIGLFNITEATAGTWLSNSSQVIPWSPYLTFTPICARYTSSSGQSIANSGAVVINFANKTPGYDPYNCVTNAGSNWAFVCPVAGYYRVTCAILFSNSAWALADSARFDFQVNTVSQSYGSRFNSTGITQFVSLNGSDMLSCSVGDTIQIATVALRSGGATTLLNDNAYNYVSILKEN